MPRRAGPGKHRATDAPVAGGDVLPQRERGEAGPGGALSEAAAVARGGVGEGIGGGHVC